MDFKEREIQMEPDVILRNGNETFIVRYGAGEEAAAMNAMANWANRPDLNFTSADAEDMASFMTKRICSGLDKFLPWIF